MGPVNKHPATHPQPFQRGPLKLAGVEGVRESFSSQLSVELHAQTHTCPHTHMHTRACSIRAAAALDAPCIRTGGYTCAHRPSAAAAPCARHTSPHEEPTHAQEHSSRRQVPHSHLTLVISWVGQSFAAHGHGLSPPQPPCEDGQLG